MHHFGGGYTDIKPTSACWAPFFSSIRATDAVALGYRECQPEDIAPIGGALETEMRLNYASVMGNCAYIFRPRSEFTEFWLAETHKLLDKKATELFRHPAKHPQDFFGANLGGETFSKYPLGWTEVLGNIFHPLIYQYRERIIFANINPAFRKYH
jgi:hypothetical protein